MEQSQKVLQLVGQLKEAAMTEESKLTYVMHDPVEINLAYMPFIVDGGLFVPTEKSFPLGEKITVDLTLPGQTEVITIIGKVVWITPRNALYHVIAGVGIQFMGPQAQTTKNKIEACLNRKVEVGGYVYGISGKG